MDVEVNIVGNEIQIIDDSDGMIYIDRYQAGELRDQLADAMNKLPA